MPVRLSVGWITLALSAALLLPLSAIAAGDGDTAAVLRVGVYDNMPLSGWTADGKPQGFFVDVWELIAKKEQISYVYQRCSLSDCLEMTRLGQLDAALVVAGTPSRREFLAFPDTSVLNNWGTVYVGKHISIESILDLNGKTVAIDSGDAHGTAFQSLIKSFGLTAEIIHTNSFAEVFSRIHEGKVDAGVVARTFGEREDRHFHVKRTSVIFNPIGVSIAFPRKKHEALIAGIDRELPRLVADQSSGYHAALDKWMGVAHGSRVSSWLYPALGLALAGLIIAGGIAYVFRRQVRKRTDEIRRQEERFRVMFDASNDAMCTLQNGVFFDFNRQTAALFGCSGPEDLLGRSPADFSPPIQPDGTPSREGVQKKIAAALAGEAVRFEWKQRKCDGTLFDTEVLLSALPVDGDRVVFGVFRDISQRKEYEHRILETSSLLKRLLEYAPTPITFLDMNNRVMLWNNAAARIYGWTEQEVYGKELPYISPEERIHVYEKIHEVHETGQPMQYESTRTTRSGKVLEVLVIIAPLRNLDGTPQGIIGIHLDITEQKAASRKVLETTELLRTIVDNAPTPILLLDAEYRVRMWNPAAERVYGWTADEVMGKAVPYLVGPEKSMVFSRLDNAFLDGKPAVYESRRIAKDGSELFVLAASAPVRGVDGGHCGVVGVHIDITEQQRLQKQLLQSQKMDAVGRLAGGIAHDFNNLLTAIIGYASFIAELAKTPEKKDAYARQIIEVANRAAALTKSLLVFSRKQETEFSVVNIQDLLNDILKLIGRVIGEDIEVTTRVEGVLLPVLGNAGQLGQVMINLATNARDAMPEGGKVSIAAEQVYIDQSFVETHGFGRIGPYIMISVSDTGTGIARENLKVIFEPFFTMKEQGKGTGLGLSIVYGIVEAHGGFIDAYSEAGCGTTFKIYLPVVSTGTEAGGIEPPGPLPGGTETILLAEDDDLIRNILTHALETVGYHVLACKDGIQARAVFMEKADTIALLLTDVIMPKMNGKMVSEEAKARCPKVKVLFLSGYTADILEEKMHLDSRFDIMYKPVSPAQLVRKVRQVLDS